MQVYPTTFDTNNHDTTNSNESLLHEAAGQSTNPTPASVSLPTVPSTSQLTPPAKNSYTYQLQHLGNSDDEFEALDNEIASEEDTSSSS